MPTMIEITFDDKEEALTALRSGEYHSALFNIREEIRRRVKYVELKTDEANELINDLYDFINSEIDSLLD